MSWGLCKFHLQKYERAMQENQRSTVSPGTEDGSTARAGNVTGGLTAPPPVAQGAATLEPPRAAAISAEDLNEKKKRRKTTDDFGSAIDATVWVVLSDRAALVWEDDFQPCR